LYLRDCASCHGSEGQGSFRGTPLVDVGAASAHFMLTTGRMPIRHLDEPVRRRPPAYSGPEINALVEFVAGLGDGPPVPRVDPDNGDLPRGGELYRLHCAPCHSSTGIGGALAYGVIAPPVFPATPTEVAESLIVGPGAMPTFAFDEEEVDAIVRYVRYLDDPPQPGGFPLGRMGRVDEGLVAWAVGTAGLVLAAVWVARRR
ncbi:MAG: c-type cytochrome, partial [Actinomycetota bacterium]|nr:c-type cytochrome [Actinomycetota bacterium]